VDTPPRRAAADVERRRQRRRVARRRDVPPRVQRQRALTQPRLVLVVVQDADVALARRPVARRRLLVQRDAVAQRLPVRHRVVAAQLRRQPRLPRWPMRT
jgi:hypothetical protein